MFRNKIYPVSWNRLGTGGLVLLYYYVVYKIRVFLLSHDENVFYRTRVAS